MINLSTDIRALSWRQPFASLMLEGKIETRTWNTDYRGPVLICASQAAFKINHITELCTIEQLALIANWGTENQVNYFNGHAIAIGNLVDCRKMRRSDQDRAYVQYSSALYCHVYENVQRIIPFVFKGKQGWTILNEEQKQFIKLAA